jgi:hypothetical protein
MDNEYNYAEADKEEIFATVRLEELQELIEDSAFLQALRNGGVGDWEWYDDVLDTFKEQQKNGRPFFLVSDPK